MKDFLSCVHHHSPLDLSTTDAQQRRLPQLLRTTQFGPLLYRSFSDEQRKTRSSRLLVDWLCFSITHIVVFRIRTNPMPPKKTQSPKSDKMTTAQLRQRRVRIARDMADEEYHQSIIEDQIRAADNQHSTYMLKLYLVIATAIIVTIAAGIHSLSPRLLRTRKKTPVYYIGTMFPPTVILDRDLPGFFQTYSIATDHNKEARNAVQKIVKSRQALKDPGIHVHLKTWDDAIMTSFLNRNLCGPDFKRAYYQAAGDFERQQDLTMWCLLATRVVDGFFWYQVDILDSAMPFLMGRGIVGKIDQQRLSTAFYISPRSTNETSMTAAVPTTMLTWMLSHHVEQFQSKEEYRDILELYLYQVIRSEHGIEHYMTLDVTCSQEHSTRAMARHFANENEDQCCEFIVPESEGGHFGTSENVSS